MQSQDQKPERKRQKLLFAVGGLLAVAAVGLLLVDTFFREDPVKQEMMQLQGTWKVVRAEINGQPADVSLFQKPYVVRGNRVLLGTADGGDKGLGIRVDPRQDPKAIDFLIQSGEEEQAIHGIYEVQGDTLKLCMRWGPGRERPTEFRVKSMLEGYMAFLAREEP